MLLTAVLTVCFFAGCKKNADYLSYVSEKRDNIYLYADDSLEIRIYTSQRENPYSADGIKGDMTSLCEIYVRLPENHDDVAVKVGAVEGEMNYKAVENCYYLSFSDALEKKESVTVTLSYGGNSAEYKAASVLDDGIISCEDAVKCAVEHGKELFTSLTDGNIFLGEIYVRLLYDDGCYYYVGVCDRNKKITAYLVDGERGKVIASHEK